MTTVSASDAASAAAAAAEADRLEREGVSYNMCDKQAIHSSDFLGYLVPSLPQSQIGPGPGPEIQGAKS